jgi:hypothetical protein
MVGAVAQGLVATCGIIRAGGEEDGPTTNES